MKHIIDTNSNSSIDYEYVSQFIEQCFFYVNLCTDQQILLKLRHSLPTYLQLLERLQSLQKQNDQQLLLYDFEINILKQTSFVDSLVCYPWIKHLSNNTLYKTKQIELNARQQKEFFDWASPSDLFAGKLYRIFFFLSAITVTQSKFMDDCSFISSLCVCASHEKRFPKSRLISSCFLFYNNQHDHNIKLFMNGMPRIITVDDYFPINAQHQLLCSSVQNGHEYWVPLLEKAFLKLYNNTYEFHGSNSGIDIYHLCGWIGEDVAELSWEEWQLGNFVATITIHHHCYAVLDMSLVNNELQIQLKNPWNQLTPLTTQQQQQQQQEDNTSVFDSLLKENGVFWMSMSQVKEWQGSIHVSYNPKQFLSQFRLHDAWQPNCYMHHKQILLQYPQYQIEWSDVNSQIWILLHRHVQSASHRQDQFFKLYCFDTANTMKIISDWNSATCIASTEMMNHLIISVKLKCQTGKCIVVIEMAKQQPEAFTLELLSKTKQQLLCKPLLHTNSVHHHHHPLHLSTTPMLPYFKSFAVEFNSRNCGGGLSMFMQTYFVNPVYRLDFFNNSKTRVDVYVVMETSAEWQLHVLLCKSIEWKKRRKKMEELDVLATSGHYQAHYTTAVVNHCEQQCMYLIPSTFGPNQYCTCTIYVYCTVPFEINSSI